jgi:hypothetical protein
LKISNLQIEYSNRTFNISTIHLERLDYEKELSPQNYQSDYVCFDYQSGNNGIAALEALDGDVRDHSRRRRIYFGRPCRRPFNIELQLDKSKLLP